jgi:hypothetical protein
LTARKLLRTPWVAAGSGNCPVAPGSSMTIRGLGTTGVVPGFCGMICVAHRCLQWWLPLGSVHDLFVRPVSVMKGLHRSALGMK